METYYRRGTIVQVEAEVDVSGVQYWTGEENPLHIAREAAELPAPSFLPMK